MVLTQIKLHESGMPCSRMSLGVWRMAEWQMSVAERLTFIQSCLELGITTFDHADIYGGYTCEGLFGEALAKEPSLRSQMQLISKCGIKLVTPNRPDHRIKYYDTSAAHILDSVENSLQELRTDYLDLLLIHRPDPFMDADDTAAAFTQLKQAGKVLHFGVSNFLPSQFDLLASRLSFPLITNQVEISVMHLNAFQDGMLDQCQRLRIAPMAWSPLGGGSLFQEDSSQALRLCAAMTSLAQELGQATIDQIALAWLLSHPASIVPILGTGNLDRLHSAVAAENLRLTREQWFAIWTASTGADVS